jgi:hypothetical protein
MTENYYHRQPSNIDYKSGCEIAPALVSCFSFFHTKLLNHRFKFGFYSFCGLAPPSSGIGKKAGDNGATGLKDIVVVNGLERGESLNVGDGAVRGFFPVVKDFVGDSVKRSHKQNGFIGYTPFILQILCQTFTGSQGYIKELAGNFLILAPVWHAICSTNIR